MNRDTTSASNLYRRKLCPGSEKMEAGLPEDENDTSREGTLLHGYSSNPKLDRSVLKPFQRELLRIADDIDSEIMDQARQQLGVLHGPDADGHETELVVADWESGCEKIIGGHCDRWLYWQADDGTVIIIDRKFGFRSVTPAIANLQLRVYAVAAFQRWRAKRVLVAISQPRLPYSERLTMSIYNDEDALLAFNEIQAILRHCRTAGAEERHADNEQCRYCKAKMLCPEYSARLSLTVSAPRDLSECTDDQLDKILRAIQFADFLKEQARDLARDRIAAGQLTNWTMAKPVETREVADVRRAMSLIHLRGLIPQSETYDSLKMSIGGLETAVRKHTGCTYKRAKELVEETLTSVIERSTKKPTISRLK